MDNQVRDYGQSNFSLPHDVVPLPSQGVFYKNKKKSIKVGYLTANDENILMAAGCDENCWRLDYVKNVLGRLDDVQICGASMT